MTTIVYDHKAKQIAVDSRCTRGSLIGGKVHLFDVQSMRFIELQKDKGL